MPVQYVLVRQKLKKKTLLFFLSVSKVFFRHIFRLYTIKLDTSLIAKITEIKKFLKIYNTKKKILT